MGEMHTIECSNVEYDSICISMRYISVAATTTTRADESKSVQRRETRLHFRVLFVRCHFAMYGVHV